LVEAQKAFRTNILGQEKRADVVQKCVMNEPRHGEVWQSVAKDPKNAGKTTEEVLNIVVGKLE
jgi:pre-mRNA-processing factor 6